MPKLMLPAAIVPLQWIVFGYATASPTDGLLRAGILLGLFNSFQYRRLMRFHNRYADWGNRDRVRSRLHPGAPRGLQRRAISCPAHS